MSTGMPTMDVRSSERNSWGDKKESWPVVINLLKPSGNFTDDQV
jgi:hypothetical protein